MKKNNIIYKRIAYLCVYKRRYQCVDKNKFSLYTYIKEKPVGLEIYNINSTYIRL